jgi:preprotein translocase subunit SecF
MTSVVPEIDYTQYSNRQLAAVPLAALAVALLVIAATFVTTGAPVALGIEFTQGTEMTVQTDTPKEELSDAFDVEPSSIQEVQATDEPRYILTFKSTNDKALADQARQNLEPTGEDANVVLSRQVTSPVFGEAAQTTALVGMAVAFLGMSVLAFVLFRTFIPSIAIVASAFSDIVIPVAVMNLLGIELSLGTVAALLMLIGYSVDSDILLNNHILRRAGEFYESTHRAMRTGVTMTLTSMSALAVMSVVAFAFGIQLMSAIGFVLVVGLATDLMNTYLMNLSLLRYYKLGGVTE